MTDPEPLQMLIEFWWTIQQLSPLERYLLRMKVRMTQEMSQGCIPLIVEKR